MTKLVISLVVVLVILGVIVALKEWFEREQSKPDHGVKRPYPFKRKPCLVSAAEKQFYDVLVGTVDPAIAVFPQITMIDLLYIAGKGKAAQSLRGKIKQRRIDFVLCERSNLRPLAAIELDDSSHERRDRMDRDQFVNAAFEDAGLPLIRIKNRRSYDNSEINRAIEQAIRPAAR